MAEIEQAALDHSIAATAAKVSATGGVAGAVLFGLTANEIAAYGGLLIALAGFIVSVVYRHREYRLKRDYYSRPRLPGGEEK